MEKEFVCTLNRGHYCKERNSYNGTCKLETWQEFICVSCPFRIEAIIIEKPEMVTPVVPELDLPPPVEPPIPITTIDKEPF